MSRRLVLMMLVAGLAAGSCSDELGRGIPVCGDPRDAGAAHLIQAQAVQTATLVPCLSDLQPGWEYQDLQPANDIARFWLDSPDLGFNFLEVRLTAACHVGDAERVVSDEPGTVKFLDVAEPILHQDVVVVPATPTETVYAVGIVVEISEETVRGKSLRFRVDERDLPADARVAEALTARLPVVVIEPQNVGAKTTRLLLPGGTTINGVTPDRVVHEIAEFTGPIHYHGSWFYEFAGGCTEYVFDAAGPRAATVAGDVADAVGFFDVELAMANVSGVEDLLPGD